MARGEVRVSAQDGSDNGSGLINVQYETGLINVQYETESRSQGKMGTFCEGRTRPLEGTRRHICEATDDNRRTVWNMA